MRGAGTGAGARRGVATAALLSLLLTGSHFALTGDAGLDLRDEGFLWYGVVRTAAGDVPLRDFQSYDPGRYYWSAAWSPLLGDGVLGLRASLAIFQALGLFCGLLAARRATRSPALLALIGTVLLLWMFPRHKLVEPGLAMMAVLFAVRLLERPNLQRHLASGLFVGMAAVFGRNHGLYAGLGQLLAMGVLLTRDRRAAPARALAAFGAGALLGFSPVIALMVGAEGFAASYARSLLVFVEAGTNLPQAIPWPWRVAADASLDLRFLASASVSLAYLAMAIVFPVGLVAAFRTPGEVLRGRALFVASVCVGVFYAHHGLVRAGILHLAQCIHPLLLALVATPTAFGRGNRSPAAIATFASLAALTGVAVAGGILPEHRALHFFSRGDAPEESYDARGDTLRLDAAQAEELRGVAEAVAARVPADAPLFNAPYHMSMRGTEIRRANDV